MQLGDTLVERCVPFHSELSGAAVGSVAQSDQLRLTSLCCWSFRFVAYWTKVSVFLGRACCSFVALFLLEQSAVNAITFRCWVLRWYWRACLTLPGLMRVCANKENCSCWPLFVKRDVKVQSRWACLCMCWQRRTSRRRTRGVGPPSDLHAGGSWSARRVQGRPRG